MLSCQRFNGHSALAITQELLTVIRNISRLAGRHEQSKNEGNELPRTNKRTAAESTRMESESGFTNAKW